MANPERLILADGSALIGPRRSLRFPPTSEDLLDDATRPYFLWWTDANVGDLDHHRMRPNNRRVGARLGRSTESGGKPSIK